MRSRTRYENELAYYLYNCGFVVCRCPASGAGKKRYPCLDLFLFKDNKVYAVEVKSVKNEIENPWLLLKGKEKEKAEELKRRGVEVLVCVRYLYTNLWKCFDERNNVVLSIIKGKCY